MPVGKNFVAKKMRSLKCSIAQRGGRLMVGAYDNRYARLTIECMRGHLFSMSAKNAYRAWCPACAEIEQQEMRGFLHARCSDLAASRGGALVSTEYVSARTPMTWRCAHHHEWKASADNVRNKNSWCPTCDHEAKTGNPKTKRKVAKAHPMTRNTQMGSVVTNHPEGLPT